MTERGEVPPGWPSAVRPPGAPRWESTAMSWLFDLCPPDYRTHGVLTRHPAVLAWLAGHHVEGQLQATRRAMSAARADLAGLVPPRVVEETVEAIEAEEARLLAAGRAITLVAQALRGVRFVPRL